MGSITRVSLLVFCLAAILISGLAQAQQPAPAATSVQAVGAVKAISGTTITMTPDAAADIKVVVQLSTQIVRVAPGQTDLKTASPIQLTDLQVGDRILVRGKLSDDKKSLLASGVMAMKRSDVEAKQAQDREDWQKRGIGGLVSAVDPATGTLTVSVAAPGGPKALAIHTTKNTVLRRYAPDSVQFDDATPGVLTQVKAGDQLRARGTRSPDGAEFAAEEIVSGSFRNISGTINVIDAAGGTLTVTDLITKKPVQVKVTSKSQVHKLPLPLAQGVAARLKGSGDASPAEPTAGASAPAGAAPDATRPAGAGQRPGGAGERPGGAGQRPAGAPDAGGAAGFARPGGGAGGAAADLQQIVSRMPPTPLTELMKGDAVMIVATQGTNSGDVTAITLLGGVEPILAAPQGSAAMSLSPWSLGGGDGGGGE